MGQTQTAVEQKGIEECLSAFSLGGNHAAALTNGKYAMMREKGQPEIPQDQIAAELEKATGVKLASATIDASATASNNEDNMRAMIFGLQQFADNVEEFSAAAFQQNGAFLLQDATKKVQQFREIIKKDAFHLVYQPIVEMKTGETHHFEALARFQHLGVSKSPFETIRFAEQAGLINDFDMAVLEKAIQKLIEVEKRGNLRKIAVNISGKSISKRFLFKRLSRS